MNRLEKEIKSAKFKDFSPTEDWTKRREENRIYLIKNEGREDRRLGKIKKADAKEILLKKVREARIITITKSIRKGQTERRCATS